MKPFNLEEAKQGKQVCTRSGLPARIICFDRVAPNSELKIVALVMESGLEHIYNFKINGMYDLDDFECELDLMMAGEKKEGWVMVCRGYNTTYMDNTIYHSEFEAESLDREDCIVIRKIEWEE